MARNSAATAGKSPDESESDSSSIEPLFTLDIPVSIYGGREYYAARVAMQSRNGILHNLRAALNAADGRTVKVTIAYE